MGFTYSNDGLLCCDFCGATSRDGRTTEMRSDTPKRGYHKLVDVEGNLICYVRYARFTVRCIRCPYGWCQKWAVCTDCKAKKRHLQASCMNTRLGDGNTHKKICKEASRRSREEERRRTALVLAVPAGAMQVVTA